MKKVNTLQEQIGAISKKMLEDQKEMLQNKNTATVMKNFNCYCSVLLKRFKVFYINM